MNSWKYKKKYNFIYKCLDIYIYIHSTYMYVYQDRRKCMMLRMLAKAHISFSV